MEALYLTSSISLTTKNSIDHVGSSKGIHIHCKNAIASGWLSKRNLKHKIACCRQTSGNPVKKPSGVALSPDITKRDSRSINGDHGSVMNNTSGITSQPNVSNSKDHLLPEDYHASKLSTSHVPMNDDESGIGITRFLGGKTFFVTGATGFLGKVLIEKILRTTPEVQKIFILVKAENKEAAMKRVENEIISEDLYKSLKQQYGESYKSFMMSKIVPVVGNVCQDNLGLDKEAADVIVKEVDIIVNSAANTSFDARYDIALDVNTCGPGRMMSFAKQCHKIKLFVQFSTAYANGYRQGQIMEQLFYAGESILPGTDLKIEDEIELASQSKQGLEDEVLTEKMKCLGLERGNKFGWQDVYGFTKAMGEMLIDKLRGNLPVVIIRPSVIESTYKEPFPGWIEGNRMMDPILLYYGKGQVTGFLANPDGALDLVPADMVVNATMAAMAKHGSAGIPESNVYQVASSVANPILIKELIGFIYEHFNSSPCIDSKGNPIDISRMELFSSMEDFSNHMWEEATKRADLAIAQLQHSKKASEKIKSICEKSVEQAKYLANLYKPYTFYDGRFDSTNTRRLMESMSKEERQQFGFDIHEIDWKEYIVNVHIPGLRRHVMKGRLG